MKNLILERKEIILSDSQSRMVSSGWSNETLNGTVVEKITYLSDGLKVKGYIAYPKDQSKKYPCIIWCRGGYKESGAIGEFNAKGIFGSLAALGFVVFSSQYRGNDGGEGKDEFGGNELNDILNLIPLADEIDCADKNKWGIEGWSRGGMMTYLTLTKTDIFKAGIIIAGISNLHCENNENKYSAWVKEAENIDSNDEIIKKCKERSAVNFTGKLPASTPLLLIHGTDDESVSPGDSLDISYKLLERKIPFRLLMLEGGDHFLRKHRKEVETARKEWLEKYLK